MMTAPVGREQQGRCEHSRRGGTDFGLLQNHFGDQPFHMNDKVEMSVHEWLQMQTADFYTCAQTGQTAEVPGDHAEQ
jgi:hypothetical protein